MTRTGRWRRGPAGFAEHGAEVLRAEPARGTFLSEVAIAAISETHERLSAEVDRRLQQLPGCLQKLTNQQRALLERCYQRQGSIKAIAEANQLDPDALYKQLQRIRRDLFECIEQALTRE